MLNVSGVLRFRNKRARITAVVALAAIAGSIGVAVVVGQSTDDEAAAQLQRASDPGNDVVVARVSGVEITQRQVAVTAALGVAGFSDGASGRRVDSMSRDEVLDHLIQNVALAQAAERAGVVVTDDEVSQSIEAGIVAPLANPDVPSALKNTVEASLRAMGTSAADAVKHPPLRDAYRRFLLVNRYASSTGSSREQLLPAALSGAAIEKVPGASGPRP